jgi:hypothetical protein
MKSVKACCKDTRGKGMVLHLEAIFQSAETLLVWSNGEPSPHL